MIVKTKTLPKLSLRTLDKRKDSLQMSTKQESVATISDTKTIPEMVKVIKVAKQIQEERHSD
jgi:hypothetical protein